MAKVYIETNGCSHNQSDSEHMAGLLAEAKYEIVDNEDSADLILFNTCTVKTPTEHAFFNRLKQAEKNNKKVLVAGCIPQSDPEKFRSHSIIGTGQIEKVVDAANATLNGQIVSLTQRNARPELLLPKIRSNPAIEIITINNGCLGACTFCKTKSARGHLNSYQQEQIVRKARQATNEGVKEIWLTSQDTACYGFDRGTNAANLLAELCKIGKDFKIRLGMGNPDHFIKITDEVIEAMKSDKVYKFLHIPAQAGNNEVLKNMGREYSAEQYKEVIGKFRLAIPNITIATDIICGFPGETGEQFEDTIKLIKETKPDVVNISRYWARGKTAAARRKDHVPDKEIMRRSEKLQRLAKEISLSNNKKWIGWGGEVLINEKAREGRQWKGRNGSYKEVLLSGDYQLGQKVRVRVMGATVHNLIADAA